MAVPVPLSESATILKLECDPTTSALLSAQRLRSYCWLAGALVTFRIIWHSSFSRYLAYAPHRRRTLRKPVAMPERNAIHFCSAQTPAKERLPNRCRNEGLCNARQPDVLKRGPFYDRTKVRNCLSGRVITRRHAGYVRRNAVTLSPLKRTDRFREALQLRVR
jgi:hypothetical protein